MGADGVELEADAEAEAEVEVEEEAEVEAEVAVEAEVEAEVDGSLFKNAMLISLSPPVQTRRIIDGLSTDHRTDHRRMTD